MSLSFLHGVPLALGSELTRLRYTEEEEEDSGPRLDLELEGMELATATILIDEIDDALETRFLRDCREEGMMKAGLKIPQLREKERMSLLPASAADAEEEEGGGAMVVAAMVNRLIRAKRSRAEQSSLLCPLLCCSLKNIFDIPLYVFKHSYSYSYSYSHECKHVNLYGHRFLPQ